MCFIVLSDVSWLCTAHGMDNIKHIMLWCVQHFGGETLRERDNLEDLSVHGMTILK